jgi:hypothetical protein
MRVYTYVHMYVFMNMCTSYNVNMNGCMQEYAVIFCI